jgi:DnaJ-domain-containing protein 1
MTDNFALFDEPRRPWIDPEALKQKFLALSARLHPDRSHALPEAERTEAGRKFSDLNAAYNCLRDSKERLRHLLQLELGEKPADIQAVPPELMDWHFEIGRLCREADAVIAANAAPASPLVKVAQFERAQAQLDKLNAMRQRINARIDAVSQELAAMNPAWNTTPPGNPERDQILKRLDEIYRLLGYLGRWLNQVQERAVSLSV